VTASAPAGLAANLSGANIAVSWSAVSGATNYRVEKKGTGGVYTLVGATASTGLTDNTVNAGSAYLYKVCVADAQNNCVSNYSNLALGTTITFATDPTITTSVTTAKAAHITELRTAVNAVRALANLPQGSWTNGTITAAVTTISKDDIRDLRDELDEALQALTITTSAYSETINGAPNGTQIKAVHINELRQRVRGGAGAAGSGGGPCFKSTSQFVKDFYQGTLQRQPTAPELAQQTALLNQAQLQGQAQLVAAAQALGTTLFTSSEYLALNTTNSQYVTDLYWGYLHRAPDAGGFNNWMNALNTGSTRAHVRNGFALSTEFQNNARAICLTTPVGNGIKYVLSDSLGSARAVMNNGAVGNSTVVSRHDYLPFGEELWAGTGLRSTAQGYNTLDRVKQKYALLERDEISGLDHTLWRKYENVSGRWTSPDPYNGSMSTSDPQSFNRYSYVQNDPVNLTDPTGLHWAIDWGSCRTNWVWKEHIEGGGDWFDRGEICNLMWVNDFFIPFDPPERPGPIQRETPKKETANECRKKALDELAKELNSRQELYPSDSSKLIGILLGAYGKSKTGALAGSVVLPGPGSVAGGIVGAAVGATLGVFVADMREASIEGGPVERFYKKDKECQKLARQEAAQRRQGGANSMQAAAPQMFVVTRQFGTFAMYPYEVKYKTSVGDYVIASFGRNPNDPVTRRFGR
jgi:RHS repeat-associated protein